MPGEPKRVQPSKDTGLPAGTPRRRRAPESPAPEPS